MLDRFTDLNAFLANGRTLDGTCFCVWEGGDLKYLCVKAGLSANFKTHDMCLWCLVKRGHLVSLDVSAPRTINSIRESAHLPPLDATGEPVWPFTCPHCDICFTEEAAHALETMNEAQLKEFPSLHAGCMWHRAPCTTTTIDHMVPCVLHMRLRFVSTLWDWCIAPAVLVKKAEVAAELLSMLQRDGVNVNRLRKINNFNDVQAVKSASFDGEGADKVLAHFDDYLVVCRSNFRDLGLVLIFIRVHLSPKYICAFVFSETEFVT